MRVVICDDEVSTIRKYTEALEQIAAFHNMPVTINSFQGGDRMLFYLEEVIKNVDIIFLDIHMPGTNGIEVARRLRDKGYEGEIIFLTMSKDAVFYAFDVRAANYLVKEDITKARLEEVFLRTLKTVAEKQSEYILLTGVGEHRNVPVASIRYFEIMQKIVTVYYGDTSFEFVSTMGKLENLLFTKGFVRISRSYLVNTKYVESISYEQVTMMSGEKLPVGRKYYKALKEAMKGNYAEAETEEAAG